ncbi:MAG TPA: glycosyltransferase, partial [Thermoanaerobaculia bacterium]|nr:glycosyltransferase [Thermoanaerobaculia bacterium]
RPAILIPFGASTHGHQLENARALSRAGAAVTIEERELSSETLAGVIRDLISDRVRLAAMAESARLLARPQATQQVASLLFEAETAR